MFYYLSKVFWFCMRPSGLLLILLVTAAALLYTRYQVTGRRLVVAAALLVVIGGLLPVGNWLILPVEDRFARPDLAGRKVDGIIVLGGMELARIAEGRGVHAVNEAAERLTEAAALSRRFPDAKIVFSGGALEIFSKPMITAEAAAMVFEDIGLPGDDRVILERKARNTWQNAVYTKELVAPKRGERWLLVTSAWHMPRAMGVFRKSGFDVEPWPVDYRTAGTEDLLMLSEAPSEGLRRLETAIREWIGLLAYWITGRTASLFPGP
jgi:uncharacterized SAM-binding protein YcdF (DUF218 family)